VKGEAADTPISDGEIYRFASYAYVTGTLPTQVNFEHPPLAKYVFGLSYLIFDNFKVFNLAVFALILYYTYQLSRRVCSSNIWQIMPTVIVASLSIFHFHVASNLLDLYASLGVLFFFNYWISEKNRLSDFTAAGLGLGVLLASKYSFTMLPILFIPALLFNYPWKKRVLIKLIIVLLIAGFVYLGSYISFFLAGNGLVDWLKFEVYRFHWFTGERPILKPAIMTTLLGGYFYAPWTDEQIFYKVDHWSILWPTSFLLQFLSIKLKQVAKLRVSATACLLLFNLLYLGMLVYSSSANARYLVVLLPIQIILAVKGLKNIVEKQQWLLLAKSNLLSFL
jgi:predicted membrane-bound dolichyl-phosphate-mannose-protein mannosyltransferase